MKRLSLIVSGLMAIAFAACTNDDFLEETAPMQSEGQPITVTAYTANDNATTRIEQTMEGDVIKLSWSNDDQFSVIRGGANSTFSKSTEEGAGANDFTGALPGIEGVCYAVYPVTTATSHEAVPFDISNQNEEMPYLMYAASESGDSYQFHHAVAYLKATFPETLKSKTATITLTLPAGVFADGTIDLATGTLSGGSKQNITKTMTFSAESTEVLLAIPPMAADNKTLQFLVTEGTNNYIATLAGTAEKAIEAGNYYTATVALAAATPCNLPGYKDGTNAFNTAIDAFLSSNSLTKIKFIANSETTSDNQIGEIGAYLVANTETSTLEIHTAADVFVFPANCREMFYDLETITAIHFNNCINTAAVTNMSYMFYCCTALTTLNLSNFNTENVTTMYYMFSYCTALTSLNVSNFNTAKVTTMSYMFAYCEALTELDLSNFNTANVTTMSYMFYDCAALISLDVSSFNTAKVTDMNYMFSYCTALTSLDLSNFNTAAVTDMSYMFRNCTALISLDVSSFNTAKVTDMSDMFSYCTALTSLDLSNFNTANVTDMSYMFSYCTALESLNLSNFNTANVTSMSYMFAHCQALTELDLSNFNTANVTTMSYMFYDCTALTSLTLGDNFDTSSVMYMSSMFRNCKALTELDLSNFNTSNVTNMNYMFYYCNALTSLDLSSFTFNATTTYTNMFDGTGSGATGKPISIYVKDQADQSTLTNGGTGIKGEYAKIEVKTNE